MKEFKNKIPVDIEWINEVPNHWVRYRLKYFFQNIIGGVWGSEPKGNRNDIICVRVADFDYHIGIIDDSNLTLRNISESEQGKRILRYGDLLLEKSGGGEKTPVGRCVQYKLNKKAVSSNFINLLSPKKNFNSDYLGYLFKFLYLKEVSYKHIRQTTGIQNINTGDFLSEEIYVPPKIEQYQIVVFLDNKTSQIERFITNRKKQIKLLLEQKEAIINKAVTKGISETPKLKDSGVEWIGSIPEHWEMWDLKYLVRQIIDCEHKTAPYIEDEKYFVVRTSNVKNGKLLFKNAKYTDYDSYLAWTKRAVPQHNDILLTREAPAGEVCIVPKEHKICLGQRMVLLQLKKQLIFPDFLLFQFLSPILMEFSRVLASGSVVTHLNIADIYNIPCPKPPLDEQDKIVTYLNRELLERDELITKYEKQINLMEEYKTSLIWKAVTGKIDLRKWKPKKKLEKVTV